MEANGTNQRIEVFREKIKAMTNEELLAMSMLLRRGTADLTEEMRVLQEMIKQRLKERRRRL